MSPKDKWKSTLQASVDSRFENASTVYGDVEEEIKMGTLEFKPILVRVNSLVDAKTGQRVNDDYKKLIFSDLDYRPEIGTRYRFDNNIWIVFSTDNIKTDTSSVYVRRCNNTMNIQDNYGNLHKEPVYIDYKITENQIFRNYSIDVPSGRIWFQCQLNKYTNKININDRYVFGDDVYRVRERTKFDRRYTFEEDSVYTLSFYADYDNKGDFDNTELGIANYKKFDYNIISVKEISNSIGFSGELKSEVYLNESVVDEPVIWESSNQNIATIDRLSGHYEFVGIGKCSFICKMANKPDIQFIVSINVENKIDHKYEDIFSPNIKTIKLNKTLEYSIYEYLDGVKTDATFHISSHNVPKRNYRLNIIDGNNFSITNLKPYDQDLKIVCSNNSRFNIDNMPIETTIYIRLGGLV